MNELATGSGSAKVDLVGNSMGGYIAAEVAIQFPERVSRLVLVSAAGISSAETLQTPILTFGRIAAALASNSVDALPPAGGAAGHAARVARPRGAPPAAAQGRTWRTRASSRAPASRASTTRLRASLDYDFRDRLPDVKVPTLIVWGEHDSIIPIRDADEFERLIEDSRKVVMKDTRPHADGRAAPDVQRRAGGLPR